MQKEYQIIDTIGRGSFGIVRKIRRLKDSKILVAKEMKYGLMSSRQKQQLVAQVNILKQLNHPNIVKYYDRIVDRKQAIVYILMEYCPGGDLGTVINTARKQKDYIHQNVIWKIFTQLLQALNFCHNRTQGKILHRDIKPANIFIDQHNNIKLGDFGLSRQMGQHSQFAQSNVGTPFYMSPQQIQEQKYNQKSDIWSAGCILYEMASLRRPFQGANTFALAAKIKQGKFDRIPINYSQNLQNLIEYMLKVNPLKRISTSQILKIPIIRVRIQQNLIKKQYDDLKIKQQQLKKKELSLKTQKQFLEQTILQKQNIYKLSN